jgi:hypothetical protein
MIVFPMVGKGSRFKKAGYNLPKFALPLNNNTTAFRAAIDSFKVYHKEEIFIFIIREFVDFEVKKFIINELEKTQIKKFEIIKLDKITSGQGETVRAGLRVLEEKFFNEELTIFNIDSKRNFFKYDQRYRKSPYLEVFVGEGNQWSFAEFAKTDNSLIRTTEKIRISKYCSNGLYHFNSCSDFIKIYDAKKDEIKKIYGETYLAPIYNYFLDFNIKCFVKLIDKNKMNFFGTPLEYEAFKNKI